MTTEEWRDWRRGLETRMARGQPIPIPLEGGGEEKGVVRQVMDEGVVFDDGRRLARERIAYNAERP